MADERQFSIVPIRALLDDRLDMADRVVLLALGAHTNRSGLCYPGQATLMRYSRLKERALRNALRHLEECGYLRTWKEGAANQYQVLHDLPALEVALLLAKGERHPGAGVASDKQHRHGGAGDGDSFGDRHPDAEPAPTYRPDRHPGADGTGTAVPGERGTNNGTTTAAAEATREEPPMPPTDGKTGSDTTDDTGASLDAMATDLAIIANMAFRDNPAMRAQAELYPLRADLALTPLKDWLAAGIPYETISATIAKVASRFKPVQSGHRISRFTYFDNAVREAHANAQANADVAAAPKRTPSTPPKVRKFA